MVMMSPQTATTNSAPAACGRIAGRTYVAWCLAAMSLLVLAGYLFDVTRSSSTAVLIAGCANVMAMALALTIPKRGRRWRPSPESSFHEASERIFERRIHEAQKRVVAPVGLRGKPRLAATLRSKVAPAPVGYPKPYGTQPGLAQRREALLDPG